jgi:chromosome segregation ATPase
MSDIPKLEQRIAQALERIRAGIDAMPAASGNRAEIEALGAEIAELEARQATLEDAVRKAEADASEARAQLDTMGAECRELQDAVQKLQAVNADLRLAAAEGVSDPEVINRALVADLEALQAARAADLRDIEALLAELAPIAKEA